jgi:hypothetical protein
VNREPSHVVSRDFDVAGMEARPHVEVQLRCGRRDLPRRLERSTGSIEGGKDPIAGRIVGLGRHADEDNGTLLGRDRDRVGDGQMTAENRRHGLAVDAG